MTTCPNCGEEADDLVGPGDSMTLSGYDRFCLIGSQSDSGLSGYRVVHI